MVGPARFRFLNETRDIAGAAAWNDPGARKLWLYNLHYFDDLNALDGGARAGWHEALIRRWVDENPPAGGNGWDPYPTSLRIVNWVKWSLRGGDLPVEAVQSLAVQARHLSRNLERHLFGNHLFANAKALVFAGAFFQGPEAESWRKKGLAILDGEIPEQVLPDGGHFERSPMYHSLILEDLLDLVNLSRAYPDIFPIGGVDRTAAWAETADRMRGWLFAMCHPDGGIALLNDAAFGIAPSPGELEAYAVRLGLRPVDRPGDGVTHLKESGYVRIQRDAAVLLLDVGPLGPDYLPAHGHADTLGFEMSLHGHRVIVDTGVSRYDDCPERLFQRGTKAHNTVVVDGQNSSEVWGSFRVARRAKPFGLEIAEEKDGITVACRHDGYRRLPGRVTHRRSWELGRNGLRIEDRLEGRFASAQHGFLLDPAVAEIAKSKIALRRLVHRGEWILPCGASVVWDLEPGKGWHEEAKYHPEFGVSRTTVRLVADFVRDRNSFNMKWE